MRIIDLLFSVGYDMLTLSSLMPLFKWVVSSRVVISSLDQMYWRLERSDCVRNVDDWLLLVVHRWIFCIKFRFLYTLQKEVKFPNFLDAQMCRSKFVYKISSRNWKIKKYSLTGGSESLVELEAAVAELWEEGLNGNNNIS